MSLMVGILCTGDRACRMWNDDQIKEGWIF